MLYTKDHKTIDMFDHFAFLESKRRTLGDGGAQLVVGFNAVFRTVNIAYKLGCEAQWNGYAKLSIIVPLDFKPLNVKASSVRSFHTLNNLLACFRLLVFRERLKSS